MCFPFGSCLGRISNKRKAEQHIASEKTCLLRSSSPVLPPPNPSSPSPSPQLIADEILDLLFEVQQVGNLNSKTYSLAHPSSLNDPIHITGWYSAVAKCILAGMEAVVKSGITVSGTIGSAIEKARPNSEDFVRKHPLWAGAIITVIALGTLYLLIPWVIEALGFMEAGPLAGM